MAEPSSFPDIYKTELRMPLFANLPGNAPADWMETSELLCGQDLSEYVLTHLPEHLRKRFCDSLGKNSKAVAAFFMATEQGQNFQFELRTGLWKWRDETGRWNGPSELNETRLKVAILDNDGEFLQYYSKAQVFYGNLHKTSFNYKHAERVRLVNKLINLIMTETFLSEVTLGCKYYSKHETQVSASSCLSGLLFWKRKAPSGDPLVFPPRYEEVSNEVQEMGPIFSPCGHRVPGPTLQPSVMERDVYRRLTSNEGLESALVSASSGTEVDIA